MKVHKNMSDSELSRTAFSKQKIKYITLSPDSVSYKLIKYLKDLTNEHLF